MDSSSWNIDMQELEYNPSKKDLTDAKIHHLLAEELVKPYRRVSQSVENTFFCIEKIASNAYLFHSIGFSKVFRRGSVPLESNNSLCKRLIWIFLIFLDL